MARTIQPFRRVGEFLRTESALLGFILLNTFRYTRSSILVVA